MKSRTLKIALAALFVLVLLFVGFSSYPELTERDNVYMNAFMDKWGIKEDPKDIHRTFEKEIDFIRKVQSSVISSVIGYNEPIPVDSVGSVEYYFRTGRGACYDRAILIEKLFSSFAFETRMCIYFFETTAAFPA